MEAIEVIDTAVKVGLGALITGLTTYAITKANHKSEKSKEAVKKRAELLTYSLEKIETYFNAMNDLGGLINGLHELGYEAGAIPLEQINYFHETDDNLVKAAESRVIASSRLKLMGLKNIASLLEDTRKLEDELRHKSAFKSELISSEELMQIMGNIIAKRDEIYELLSNEFTALYE
ncbi:hypothetical protein [Cellvibrio sp. UBA7671]|uniref:hypothetical protein n=1 Tax=Cellvibrio sp. UBA7671 TaxID=1946312 RepID=UPI002F355A88